MGKIRTIIDLQDTLDKELSWRKLELSNFKSVIPTKKNILQQALIRAGIALLYAHWEGYIKNVCESYLHFVSMQGRNHLDLKSCFLHYSIENLIKTYGVKANSVNFMKFDLLIQELNAKAYFNYRNKIKTKSNLKFEVFDTMLNNIGFDSTQYSLKAIKINELVDKRNGIAHGEFSFPDYDYYLDIYDLVLQFIHDFKDDIVNAAQSGNFLR